MEAILVWRFKDAPQEFRKLSCHGGDEDWVAVIPAEMGENYYIPWLESGGPFGWNSVSEHDLPDGRRVHIGAHA